MAQPRPADLTFVLDHFEQTAEKYPRDTAIIFDDGDVVNYGDLNELAEGVASVVSSLLSAQEIEGAFDDGLVATPLVAMMMDRNVAFVASMLGVLKAEAGYVPIDPTFPADRQSYIFEQSKCVCLLVDMENYQRALDLGVTLPKHVVRINGKTGLCENHTRERSHRPQRLNDPNSLAYVLYTSGSTGKPKGVMVKNVGVMNQINWFAESLGAGKHTRVLGLATFCFDISVLEIYLPLTRGGLLVLASASTQKDPFRILELIKQHKVTFFQATPTTYDMMAAVGWKGEAESSIDFLVGGEAFRPSLLPFVRNGRSFRNVYGPTETTVWASEYLVPKDFPVGVMPPVGRPGPNYSFRVVDHAKGAPWQEVGPGQEGELWISGISVGRGYLGRPELTKEVYLPDPFAAGRGLVYRTGDLVKLCDDGVNYQFLQRIDNQVKIDGYRIELAEIENVYTLHDLVEQAVAIVSDKKLVIYLKPSSADRSLSAAQQEEVHAFARRKLMHYMMPKATVVVPAFQLTATSKIDRKALPPAPWADEKRQQAEGGLTKSASSHSFSSSGSAKGASQARREKSMVAVILAAVENSSGKRLGPSSSFAAMGVDSLGAVLFIKELSDRLGGLHLAPKRLFAPGMTVKLLATELQQDLIRQSPGTLVTLGVAHLATDQEASELDVAVGSCILHDPRAEDDDGQGQGADEDDVETEEQRAIEQDFTTSCIASNRKLFEGLRGLVTYVVLAGHFFRWRGLNAFAPQNTWTPETINYCYYCTKGDLYLFIMLTGLATSLQLRLPPMYERRAVLSNSNSGVDSGVDVDAEKQSATTERTLVPRKPFAWTFFLVTRAMGIFPLLWVALLFNIPVWYKPDLYSDGFSGPNTPAEGSEYAKKCAVLYVIGMQSWDRPSCSNVGPNTTVYASCILNIFIIYSLFRLIIRFLQDRIMPLRQGDFALPAEKATGALRAEGSERDQWGGGERGAGDRTWWQWVGNCATMAAYNRPANTEQALVLTGFWFIAIFFQIYKIFTDAAFLNVQTQNAIAYMPYFLLGCALASVLEVWHAALYIVGDSDGRPLWRRRISHWISRVYRFSNGDDEKDEAAVAEELREASLAWLLPVLYAWRLVWRFLPDAIFVGAACATMQVGWLFSVYYQPRPATGLGTSAEYVIWFIGLPLVGAIFVFISCMQRGPARRNLSRLFLESPLMENIGYCSYPVYLLQFVFFEYYTPRLYYSYFKDDPNLPWAYNYPPPYGRPTGGSYKGYYWFVNLFWGVKVICFLILIVLCWFLQKIVQDTVVPFLYVKALGLIRRASKAWANAKDKNSGDGGDDGEKTCGGGGGGDQELPPQTEQDGQERLNSIVVM